MFVKYVFNTNLMHLWFTYAEVNKNYYKRCNAEAILRHNGLELGNGHSLYVMLKGEQT